MMEIKTEPLAAPTETAQAPQPSQPAKPVVPTETNVPARISASTKKWLLYAVGAYLAIMLLALLAQVPRWTREARDRRVNTAVNTVTPDSVLARCGQPVEDVTKDLYPMIARTMTYNSPIAGNPGPGKVVLFFSRTAEEKSDWLYSSMKSENGTATYNTPEEQVAALPCLASTK